MCTHSRHPGAAMLRAGVAATALICAWLAMNLLRQPLPVEAPASSGQHPVPDNACPRAVHPLAPMMLLPLSPPFQRRLAVHWT